MTISGKSASNIMTIDNGYSANMLQIKIGDEWYRMQVSELLKVIPDLEFEVEQKRKYKHVTITQRKEA